MMFQSLVGWKLYAAFAGAWILSISLTAFVSHERGERAMRSYIEAETAKAQVENLQNESKSDDEIENLSPDDFVDFSCEWVRDDSC